MMDWIGKHILLFAKSLGIKIYFQQIVYQVQIEYK